MSFIEKLVKRNNPEKVTELQAHLRANLDAVPEYDEFYAGMLDNTYSFVMTREQNDDTYALSISAGPGNVPDMIHVSRLLLDLDLPPCTAALSMDGTVPTVCITLAGSEAKTLH